jgi:hypothetical protein
MGVGHTNLLSRLQFALIRQGNSLRAMTCAGGVGTALSANWMRLLRAVDYTRFSSACLVQSKSPSEQQGEGFLRKSLGHAPESVGSAAQNGSPGFRNVRWARRESQFWSGEARRDDDMSHDDCIELLKQCEAKIARLEEENRQLRRSAAAFGQLAERLNEELQRARRLREPERRQDETSAGQGHPSPTTSHRR